MSERINVSAWEEIIIALGRYIEDEHDAIYDYEQLAEKFTRIYGTPSAFRSIIYVIIVQEKEHMKSLQSILNYMKTYLESIKKARAL